MRCSCRAPWPAAAPARVLAVYPACCAARRSSLAPEPRGRAPLGGCGPAAANAARRGAAQRHSHGLPPHVLGGRQHARDCAGAPPFLLSSALRSDLVHGPCRPQHAHPNAPSRAPFARQCPNSCPAPCTPPHRPTQHCSPCSRPARLRRQALAGSAARRPNPPHGATARSPAGSRGAPRTGTRARAAHAPSRRTRRVGYALSSRSRIASRAHLRGRRAALRHSLFSTHDHPSPVRRLRGLPQPAPHPRRRLPQARARHAARPPFPPSAAQLPARSAFALVTSLPGRCCPRAFKGSICAAVSPPAPRPNCPATASPGPEPRASHTAAPRALSLAPPDNP